jgi:flavin-dependent dehydrogenase
MTTPFDAAIVGGGPAGATVAMCLARRGWRVCLCEATRFDGDRYGETLPPEINPLLRELGVFDEFRALAPLESPGIVSAWGGPPSEQDYLCNPHGPGWHIDRNRFDQMLCRQAAAAGAEVFEGCRAEVDGDGAQDIARRIEARQNGALVSLLNRDWGRTAGTNLPTNIRTSHAGPWRIGDVTARVLVDASGRNGLRIGRDGQRIGGDHRETEDRLLAIVLRLIHPNGAPPDQRTYVESTRDGWWYSAPLPQGETIAMFFTDCAFYMTEGIAIEEQLSQAPLTRGRLLGATPVATRTVYASSSCRASIAGEAWLAVGDSASSYDPLSGRGILKALRQATNAAIAVDGFLRGETGLLADYAALIRREFDAYALERRAHYSAETRWPGRVFRAATKGSG